MLRKGLAELARPLASRCGARSLAAASGNVPEVDVHNPNGTRRVVVTKPLPGSRWVDVLTNLADCRVEVCKPTEEILSNAEIASLIGSKCDGAIGQLTEKWDDSLFETMRNAGATAFSNYAVGYDNVRCAMDTPH